MIEEMLMVIIEREFKHAEALEAARLGFSQKLNMVKAIVKTKIDDHFDTVFTAINDLNEKLRNPLVHRLEHKDMEQRVDRFCEFVETRISPTTSTTREGTERLRFALAKLHTSTHVMIVAVSALRRRRPHSVSTPK
jgi:hypothetical protein